MILPSEETTANSILDVKISLLPFSIFCSRTSLTGLFSTIFETTVKSSSKLAGAIYFDESDFITRYADSEAVFGHSKVFD